jgi:hypothetical protein
MNNHCEDETKENIENNPNLVSQFQYPNDEPMSGSLDARCIELINQLAAYILPSRNPRLTFTAMLYSAGMDVGMLFGTNNTATSLSKALGIPKQTFSYECHLIRKAYGLHHSPVFKHNVKEDSYQYNSKNTKS